MTFFYIVLKVKSWPYLWKLVGCYCYSIINKDICFKNFLLFLFLNCLILTHFCWASEDECRMNGDPSLRARGASQSSVSATRLWKVLPARVTLFYICEGKQQTSAKTAWGSDKWRRVTSHAYHGRRNDTCPQAHVDRRKERGAQETRWNPKRLNKCSFSDS